MTAAITWAVLATVGAVAVYWLMRRARDEARGETARMFKRAADISTQWREDVARIADERDLLRYAVGRLHEEFAAYRSDETARRRAHMREIGIRGNKSPKRKAAVQRLQVVGKAAEINREMGR